MPLYIILTLNTLINGEILLNETGCYRMDRRSGSLKGKTACWCRIFVNVEFDSFRNLLRQESSLTGSYRIRYASFAVQDIF